MKFSKGDLVRVISLDWIKYIYNLDEDTKMTDVEIAERTYVSEVLPNISPESVKFCGDILIISNVISGPPYGVIENDYYWSENLFEDPNKLKKWKNLAITFCTSCGMTDCCEYCPIKNITSRKTELKYDVGDEVRLIGLNNYPGLNITRDDDGYIYSKENNPYLLHIIPNMIEFAKHKEILRIAGTIHNRHGIVSYRIEGCDDRFLWDYWMFRDNSLTYPIVLKNVFKYCTDYCILSSCRDTCALFKLKQLLRAEKK